MRQEIKKGLLLLLAMLLCLETVLSKGLGGTFFALGGKDCVVMATDSRFSGLRNGGTFITQDPRAIYKLGDRTLLGSFGLETDADSLVSIAQNILIQNLLDSETTEPCTVAKLISILLYSGKYFSSPLIAGLMLNGKPYICSMDGIGAQTHSSSFAAVGTSANGLLAICESLYQPNLSAPALVALAEKCLGLAFQRDVLSGGGKMKIVTLRMRKSKNLDVFTKIVDYADS